MRHELQLGEWIVTSDNSAGIGEKPADVVGAPDGLTAKFAARVALLEQWAAGSDPEAVLLHNFSGEAQWDRYIEGITELFEETGLDVPRISGSSETNMETLQSGLAVTMIGKRTRAVPESGRLRWFVYGHPLVGRDVLDYSEQVADLKKIHDAMCAGLIARVWPVGSKGIAREAALLFGEGVRVAAEPDLKSSGGPAACVLIGAEFGQEAWLKKHFGNMLFPLEAEEN